MKIIRPMQIIRIWALALGLFTAAGAQAAGPWYVATNGADTGNNGQSWSQPFASISNALTNAGTVVNETIWVSNGTYIISDTVSNPVAKACLIRAWSTNPADTVLYGPGTNDVVNIRGVYMNGSGSLLEGFTVTNFYYGGSTLFGGGVYCVAGLISNCIVTGNTLTNASAGNGGGIYLESGGVAENCSIIGNRFISPSAGAGGGGIASNGRIRNCRIVGNIVAGPSGSAQNLNLWGGGVIILATDTSIMQDSIIASNVTMNMGGGIVMRAGIISNCQVFANTTTGYGVGGIWVRGDDNHRIIMYSCVVSNNRPAGSSASVGGIQVASTTNLLISRCMIVNNYANDGPVAGLDISMGVRDVRIQNCLVAGNTNYTTYNGAGGMRIFATNALIENCTIASNMTGGSTSLSGGISVSNGVRVVNSIIYHNLGMTTSSNIYASADCTFSNNCVAPLPGTVAWTGTGTANTDADPKFVAKDTGNFRLSARSPCINTGTNQNWMTNSFDLEGKKRMRYGTVDMGAYERIYDGSIYSVR